jgi:CheY-like chemotaxis protein
MEKFVSIMLDRNICFRVLIVDSDNVGAGRLAEFLLELQPKAITVSSVIAASIPEAYQQLGEFGPNVVFIDLVSSGVRDSVTFIQHVRQSFQTIVFVLYSHTQELTEHEGELYTGWGSRLRHYFLLPKETSNDSFSRALLFNLNRVQLDLYAYGAQKLLTRSEHVEDGSTPTPVQLSKLNAQVGQIARELSILTGGRHSYETESRHAFVVMAFVDELTDCYEIGIKEGLQQLGIKAVRSDEQYHDRLLIERIYEDIHNAAFVVAELSLPKPNCYYELGFADALNKTVIRLARVGTEIPFDVNQYQFIFYSGIHDLRRRLSNAVRHLGFVNK